MTKKLVDGELVELSPTEQAEYDASQGAPTEQPVPDAVPMLNAHLALISAGWMPGVREYLDALPGAEGLLARTYFEKAQTVRRDHQLVQAIPAALGKTSAEVDALFVAAAALNP